MTAIYAGGPTLGQVLDALNQGFEPPSMWMTDGMVEVLTGLKQSMVASRLQIDASIVSLWRQRKRPVPGYRIAQLLVVLMEHNYDPSAEAARPQPLVSRVPILDESPDESEPALDRLLDLPIVAANGNSAGGDGEGPIVPLFQFPTPDSESTWQRVWARREVYAAPGGALLPGPPPLAWCESDHGSGKPRRHHHGPAASWGPSVVTSTDQL